MPTADQKGILYLDNETVKGDCFIPHAFALEKLKIASSQYIDMKISYDQHIADLKASHDSHCKKTQIFYEEYIKEMKCKAKQHVEGQSILKQEILDDFRQKFADSEEVVERLRDQLSNLRLTFQEDSRSLKQQLTVANENEIVLHAREYDASVRNECATVISDLLIQIEATLLRQDFNEKMCIASKRIEYLTGCVVKTSTAACKENNRIHTEMKTERECRVVMQSILLQIDMDAAQEQKARNNQMDMAEKELRERCQAAEMSVIALTAGTVTAKAAESLREAQNHQIASDKSAAALTAMAAQHELLQNSLQQDHDGEVAALNKQFIELSSALATATALSAETSRVDCIKAEKLRCSLNRAQVQACVSSMVADVSDRELWQTNQILLDERVSHKKDISTTDCVVSGLEQQVKELLQHIESMAVAEEKRERDILIEEAAAVPSVAEAAVSVVPPVTVSTVIAVDTAVESQEILALRLEISRVEKELIVEKQTVSVLDVRKTNSKAIIVGWVAQFEVENKRAPVDADKEMVRDKYQTYKNDTMNLKSAIAVTDGLQRKKADLEEKLLKLNKATKVLSVVPRPKLSVITDQLVCTDAANSKGAAISISSPVPVTSLIQTPSRFFLSERGPRPEDVVMIEGLEDSVYQLQQDIAQSTATVVKLSEESIHLTQQLDAITREKRTDVVKRFEEEILSLTAQRGELKESIVQLETVRAKNKV